MSVKPNIIAIAFRDGHVEIRIGTQDIGTGTRTIIAMVAAEELGLPLARVVPSIGDTRYPFSVPSGGSMTAPSDTPAVRQAAAHLRDKLFRIAAPMLNAQPDELGASNETIRVRNARARAVAFADVCRRIPADSLTASGEHVPNYGGYRGDQSGCQFAEVEVDVETGVVRVLDVVAVHDACRIVNPLTARSQVNGGVIMGVGFALFEDRRIDPRIGLMVNPTMDDYKLPGSLDIPNITVLFVDVANGNARTGVPSASYTAHPIAAALATCAASPKPSTPVLVTPMTPDRVLAALGKV